MKKALLVAGCVVVLLVAVVAVGSWMGYLCPIAYLRFAPYTDTLSATDMLEGATCIAVSDPGGGLPRRITDPTSISRIQSFLTEHRSRWGEHVFSWEFEATEVTFRVCERPYPKFILGEGRLGREPGKGFARPICRRDHDALLRLLRQR